MQAQRRGSLRSEMGTRNIGDSWLLHVIPFTGANICQNPLLPVISTGCY
jgi:hypothetical protein